MRRMILAAIAVLALAYATGCAYVTSAQGGNTGKTNEAWFVEGVGLGPMMIFSHHVYYCPPMGSGGASTCTEAEMIEGGQPAAGGTVAPTPTEAPPAPAGEPPAGEPPAGE